MEYETWDAIVNNQRIHFEFLPERLDDLRQGDCVLLYKPYLNRFIEHGLGAVPYYAAHYQYPDYIKRPQPNWEILLTDWFNILYQVNSPLFDVSK